MKPMARCEEKLINRVRSAPSSFRLPAEAQARSRRRCLPSCESWRRPGLWRGRRRAAPADLALDR